MSQSAPQTRDVQVAPLSMPAELGLVALLCIGVVAGVWLYLRWSLGTSSASQRNLLPFQALIEDRPSEEQRVFRYLQEGILEAETRRSTTGAWPDVPALAADGIPPFAPDPTEKSVKYTWRLLRDGAYVNYLGIPDRPGMPAWLVLVIEPQFGVPDPAKEDETHHRLLDGTTLQVSTWNHTKGGAVKGALLRVPQSDGWTQLYAVAPAVGH
jgi:hypothetical protein